MFTTDLQFLKKAATKLGEFQKLVQSYPLPMSNMSNNGIPSAQQRPARPLPVSKSQNDRVPSAPTTEKPPFTFRTRSPPPHGVPVYPSEAAKEFNIHIPTSKKKKTLSAAQQAVKASQPATATAAPAPQPQATFKCTEPGCGKTFNNVNTFGKHEEEHKEEEPNPEDALAWCLEQLRKGLGVDEQGKSLPKPQALKMEKGPSAQSMKRSASSQGLKPSGVPMSRGPSSQQGGIRTPVSDTKGTPVQSQRATPTKTRLPPGKDLPTPPYEYDDLWAGLAVTPALLRTCVPTSFAIDGVLDLTDFTPTATDQSSSNSPANGAKDKSKATDADAMDVDIDPSKAFPSNDFGPPEDWLPKEWIEESAKMGVPAADLVPRDMSSWEMDWADQFGPQEEARRQRIAKPQGVERRMALEEVPFDSSLFCANLQDDPPGQKMVDNPEYR